MEEITLENWETLPPLTDADSEELAKAAVWVLDSKRGRDIAVLPVTGRSDITDCLVLVSATSGPHVRALAGELEHRMAQRGVHPLQTDGCDCRDWMVVDYGTLMVHIFNQETREFYHLDKLFANPDGGESREDTK